MKSNVMSIFDYLPSGNFLLVETSLNHSSSRNRCFCQSKHNPDRCSVFECRIITPETMLYRTFITVHHLWFLFGAH